MSLLLAQLSAGGSILDGAAAVASVSTWSASGEAVGSGAVKEGAADLAIESVWTATGSTVPVTTSGGGGYFPTKKRRKPPIQFPKRISIKTAAAAVCRSGMEWGAQAVAIRTVTAQAQNTSRMTSRPSRRAAGAAVVRNRSFNTGRGVPIRGIGMTETEAALIFSLIE
jgi:hypothetical protein